MSGPQAVYAATAGAVGAVFLGELAAWRASTQYLPGRAPRFDESGTKTVVVLGCPSAPDGSPSWVQRRRIRIALRCYRRGDTVIFCGGITRGSARSEAAVMADHAVSLGLPRDSVVVEGRSQTTWQNIENALPLIGPGAVVIASDTFHARRARRYIWLQDTAIGGRLRKGCDYRPGELFWLKPLMAVVRR
jgi:uncharacterized SAM-binding protein YcdF (DUF218 family)